MAAEYDMQEDRGLESLPLFHTMIRYNATHHTNNEAQLGIYYIHTAFAVCAGESQARYSAC